MDAATWCRCASPLPPKTEKFGRDWTCSACNGARRYHETLTVQNGGIVSQCGECRYEARKRGAKVASTLCRAVTCTTQLAGEFRERAVYYLCDACIDAEIARQHTADVIDGRQSATAKHPERAPVPAVDRSRSIPDALTPPVAPPEPSA